MHKIDEGESAVRTDCRGWLLKAKEKGQSSSIKSTMARVYQKPCQVDMTGKNKH